MVPGLFSIGENCPGNEVGIDPVTSHITGENVSGPQASNSSKQNSKSKNKKEISKFKK